MTALFPVKTLDSITVVATPAAPTCLVGGTTSVALVVTAHYLTGTATSEAVVTTYTTGDNWANGVFTAKTTVAGTENIVVTYVEGGVTKTANVAVTVSVEAPKVTTVTVTLPTTMTEASQTAAVVLVKDQFGATMTTGFTTVFSITTGSSTVSDAGLVTAGSYSTTATLNAHVLTATVTPTTGTAVTGTANFTVTADTTKPTIVKAEALNNKTLVVTFSKKVADSALAADTNVYKFKLYNTATGKMTDLVNTAGYAAGTNIELSTPIFADTAKTQVKLTIKNNTVDGYPAGGFAANNYMVYVTGVVDTAATPNTIVASSNYTFMGTTTPDSTPATIVSAAYDTGLGQLVITFDKFVSNGTGANYTIINGSTNEVLTGLTGTASTTVSTMTFDLTSSQMTSLGALQTGATVSIAVGGVTDTNSNANTVVLTKELTATVRPALSAAAYDETTNKITLTFTKPVQLASFNRNGFTYNYVVNSVTTSLAVSASNLTVETTGTSAQTIVLAPNQAGILQLNAQRAVSGVTYSVKMADGTVTDSNGVTCETAADAGQTIAMTYTKETTVPTIASVSYKTSNNTLTVLFSERMNTTVGSNGSIYLKTKNAAGDALATLDSSVEGLANTITWSSDGKSAEVILDGTEAPKFEAADSTTQYGRFLTLIAGHGFADVNRNALADITTAAAAIAVTYLDDSTVSSLTAEDHGLKLIYLTFSAGSPSDACANATYAVYESGNVNASRTIEWKQVLDLDNNGVKETIVLKLSDSTPLTNAAAAGYYTVSYSGLTTLGGVTITDGTVVLSAATAIAADATSPILKATKFYDVDSSKSVTAGDKFDLVYDEPVALHTSKTLTQAELGTGNSVAYATTGNNILSVTLGSTPTLVLDTAIGAGVGTALTNAADANQIKDISAVAWTVTGDNKVVYPADALAPTQTGNITVTDTDSNGAISANDTVTIPFDVDLKTGLTLANVVIYEDAGASDPIESTYTATVSGKNVIVTFNTVDAAEKIAASLVAVKVKITGSGSNIKSTWGRETGDMAAKAPTFDNATLTKPTMESATYNATTKQLKVVFNKAVNLQTGLTADLESKLFTLSGTYNAIMGGTGLGTNYWLDTADTTNKTVVFWVSGATVIDAGITTMNIIAGGSTEPKLLDFYGNMPRVKDATGVTIAEAAAGSDTTAPTLSSAKYLDANADGAVDQVELTFSEAISTFVADNNDVTWVANDITASAMGATNAALVPTFSSDRTKVTFALSTPGNANITGHSTAPTIKLVEAASTQALAIYDLAGNAFVDMTSAINVSDGAAPNVTKIVVTDLSFSNAANKVVLANTAIAAGESSIFEVYFGSSAPADATTASYTKATAASHATGDLITGIAAQTAGNGVYYRLVDAAGNKTTWVQDGTIPAAPTAVAIPSVAGKSPANYINLASSTDQSFNVTFAAAPAAGTVYVTAKSVGSAQTATVNGAANAGGVTSSLTATDVSALTSDGVLAELSAYIVNTASGNASASYSQSTSGMKLDKTLPAITSATCTTTTTAITNITFSEAVYGGAADAPAGALAAASIKTSVLGSYGDAAALTAIVHTAGATTATATASAALTAGTSSIGTTAAIFDAAGNPAADAADGTDVTIN